MKKISWKIILVIVLAAAALFAWKKLDRDSYVDVFSGATPLALERKVPRSLVLTIEGRVKQTHRLDSNALCQFAGARVRTREIAPGGEILGAYIYNGIPVQYILEGVAPLKTSSDAYDRPLDMMVIFHSSNGKTSRFSYGELTMTDDNHPVMLAYHREQLLPSKDPQKYTRNAFKGNITGLRLICPRERDTGRYLDDVVTMTLVIPESSVTRDDLLPRQQKGKKCSSEVITCIGSGSGNNGSQPANFNEVSTGGVTDWLRIGHGRGIKGDSLEQVQGYSLPSFLRKNFPTGNSADFYLFVACDGYRSLFSGREIFDTGDGEKMLLVDEKDGGKNLTAAADFFVDRNIWGLSYIVHIPAGLAH